MSEFAYKWIAIIFKLLSVFIANFPTTSDLLTTHAEAKLSKKLMLSRIPKNPRKNWMTCSVIELFLGLSGRLVSKTHVNHIYIKQFGKKKFYYNVTVACTININRLASLTFKKEGWMDPIMALIQTARGCGILSATREERSWLLKMVLCEKSLFCSAIQLIHLIPV